MRIDRGGRLVPYLGLGFTASALPPPSRTGSAIASARPCAEHLQRGRIPRIVVEREDRPGGERELLAVLARELLGERAVVEVRLGQRGVRRRVRLAHPGRGERVGQAHAEVDVVDQGLDDGRDDRRAAGGADRELGLAVAQRDDRAHARPWLLAGRRQVRVIGAGRGRGEVEVGQLVVEQEAVAGHDLAAAAEEVDRVRVGDDVTPLVLGDDVVRVMRLGRCRG